MKISPFMQIFGNNHRLVNCLYNIKARCNNPKNPSYKNYGGRGISCFINLKQLQILWIKNKASLMKRPSLDRIDNNGHYTLQNCRFIESSENSKKMNRERSNCREVLNSHIINYHI